MHTSRIYPLVLLLTASLSAQQAPTPAKDHALRIDSGYADNASSVERVVFRKDVSLVGATWARLYFDQTNLPSGSRLELTSLEDQGKQTLDARSLRDYGDSSCYFNGARVRVVLIAGPRTKANRVLIVGAKTGLVSSGQAETICGNTDDRVKSADKRQGRLSSGCTGWLINSDVMLTAGHCIPSSGALVLSFNVPNSKSDGTLVQSDPKDQYPVIRSSIRRLNGGVGADWAAARVGANSTTKQLPGDAQGSWYRLGAVPSSTSGQKIRITGYGTTTPRNALNQVQKTHVGPLFAVAGTSVRYRTDTTGGNSGSPVVHENTGRAIGIHTHGGCTTSTNSANYGTRIDRADLLAAIRGLNGKDGRFEPFGRGCLGSNNQRPTLSGGGNPQIGRLASISVNGLIPLRLGFFVFGVSNTKAKPGYKLPLDLSFIGMTGCFQYTSASVYRPVFSLPGGSTGWLGYIPRDPNMVNTSFFIQYFSSDQKANPFGTTSSNGLKVTIGG